MAKELNLKVNVEGGKEIDDLNESLATTNEEVAENTELLDDNTKAQEGAAKASSKLKAGLKAAGDGGKKLGQTLGKVAKNIFFVVIGALVVTLGAIKEAMSTTQEGSDALGQGFAFLTGFIQPLIDILGKAGVALFEAFSKPKESWESFKQSLEDGWNFMQKNLLEPMKASFFNLGLSINKGFKEMSIAAKEFFGADATELKAELEIVKDKIAKNNEIIKASEEAWIEVGESIIETTKALIEQGIESGKQFAALEAQAQRLERQKLAELKFNTQIKAQLEELKNIRDVETNSLEDRIKANDELAVLEQQRVDFALKTKQQEIDLLGAELALRGNNLERQTALATAQAEYNDLVGESAGILNEQLTNNVGLRREEAELLNAQIDLQSELAQVSEESELKKAQIVLDANKAKAQSYRDLGLVETQEYRDAVNAVALAEAEKLKLIEDAQKEAISIVRELQGKAIENEIQAIKDETELRVQALTDAGMITKELRIKLAEEEEAAIGEVRDRAREEERKASLDSVNKAANQAAAVVDSLQGIMDGIEVLMDQAIERRNQKIVDDNQAAQFRLEERFDNEMGSLEERAANELALNGVVSIETQNQIIDLNNAKLLDQYRLDKSLYDAQKKSDEQANKQKLKAFKINKALAIATATINTALAVTSALTTTPYPLGVGLAVAAGIAGGIQIAAIASERFQPTSTTGTAPKRPKLASHVKPQDQTANLGLGAATGDLSNDAVFNKQELFAVGAESVGGEAGERQLRVTVLESDITNTQQTVSTIESAAEFGG